VNSDAAGAALFGPWNPGLLSRIPGAFAHLATIFRPENVFTSLADVRELSDLTGLDPVALVVFRPQRLALHEVLVRVMADLSVPDGSRIEDLGINFRAIVRTILAQHVEPRMDVVTAAYEDAKSAVAARIDAELATLLPAPDDRAGAQRSWLATLFRRRAPVVADNRDAAWAPQTLARWEERGRNGDDVVERASCRALSTVTASLLSRHGQPWGTRELIAAVATGLACNDVGADRIGAALEPLLSEAAEREGFRRVPAQQHPVVMNTKGPSASGKSTLRPLQRRLAGRIGVDWAEFALISPDIWRKQLLDYASLGDAYKYAGAFTGDELHLIDCKLDAYMARKGTRGAMTHLLIDRFRFDSFAPDSEEAGSNLLTRFGQIVYLFFMITPPASLVERAWHRGLEVGRYKAVDDVLAHGVEAYAGMPGLFFTWANRSDKNVHFEFLDNSVAQGERPLTVAFGWNDTLNILDVRRMLDVERYRRVDIDARSPESLYPAGAPLDAAANAAFLVECVHRFREVNFADQASGRIYARVVSRRIAWTDPEALADAAADADTRDGLAVAAPGMFAGDAALATQALYLSEHLDRERIHTLGRWGPE
jgi:hypothetical protein